MKVRIIKNFGMKGLPGVTIEAGSILEAAPKTAGRWITSGVAEPCREATVESAVAPEPENAMRKAAPRAVKGK